MNKKIYLPLTVLILGVFLIGLVSAAEWDNNLDYEDNDMKLVITNWLGFGEKIGEATLTSHKTADEVRNVIRGKDRVVMYYDFNFDEIYENGLGDVSFIDMRTGKEINKEYHFVYEDPIPFEVPVLKKECQILKNSSELCESVIDYYDTRYRSEWKEFNGKDIPKGNIRIGLATDVNAGDYIDAVWTIAGKKISRHAVWTDGLNVDLYKYYNFTNEDEWVSGSPDLVAHEGVMTFNSSGLIGNAGNSNDTDSFNITDDNTVMAMDGESALNFWVQPRTSANANGFIRKTNTALNQGWGFHQLASGGLRAGIEWGNTDFASILTVDTWTMITVSRNSTETCLWADAVLKGCMDAQVAGSPDLAVIFGEGTAWSGSDYDGLFDEMGFWSRSLTDAEITQLYNSGTGITAAITSFEILLTLTIPTNNTVTTNNSLFFNSTLVTTGTGNLTNATIHIWNSTDGLFNQTTNQLFQEVSATNYSTWDINFTSIGLHKWNVLGCGVNETGDGICSWATNNNTFFYQGINNSFTFNSTIYETADEYFQLNITAPSQRTLSSGTLHVGTSTSDLTVSNTSLEDWLVTGNLDIPLGVGQTNITWEITYDNSQKQNFSTNTTVAATNFTLCDGTIDIPYINFTFQDEVSLASLNGTIISGTFEYWIGSGDVKKTLSYSNSSLNNEEYGFCASPSDQTLNADIDFGYAFTDYPQRSFNPSTLSLTNTTTEQVLQLLGSTDGIFTTFQVINPSNQVLSGVDVTAVRNIAGTNTTIGQATTGDDGSVTFWLNPNFIYAFRFEKAGFDPLETSFAPTQSGYTIALGGSSSKQYEDFTKGITLLLNPPKPSSPSELVNDTTYNFNMTMTTSFWDLDSWGFSIKNQNGEILASNFSTSSSGGFLGVDLNTGSNITFIMNYNWTINGTTLHGTTYWNIRNTANSGFSIKTFFTDLDLYIDSGLFGIDTFGKNLIIFLIIFISIGVMSYKFGLQSPVAISIMLFAIILFFDWGIGILPSPVIGISHFPTYIAGLIVALMLLREVTR